MTIYLDSQDRARLPSSLALQAKGNYERKLYFLETSVSTEFKLVPADEADSILEENIVYTVNLDSKRRMYLRSFLKIFREGVEVSTVEIFMRNRVLYMRV